MKRHLILTPLLALFAIVNAQAQIGISGVANNTMYTTSAAFFVTNEAGFAYDARLDGAPVAVGVSVPVTKVDYHELYVLRTNISTLAVANRLVKFIVKSAERGSTEDGIPPWTPYPLIPSAGGEFVGGTFRLIAPEAYPQGMQIPIVAWIEDGDGHALRVNGTVAAPGQSSFKLVRGVGSGFLSASNAPGVVNYQPAVGGLTTNKTITIETGTVWTGVAGTLSGAINWPAHSRIAITNHVILASGATLTIGAGTIVRISPGVDITNNAAVIINGTREQPVVFAPISPAQPWGGFLMRASVGSITGSGVIFTGSGANPLWFNPDGQAEPASHRREQALFFCSGTNSISLTDAAAISLAGQLAHSQVGGRGQYTFTHFLMQRCTSGGEFTDSAWTVNDSAFIECPDDTVNYVDGDNDALYFKNGTHGFTNSLFGVTKDDGVDSGGSGAGTLNFQNCWFESTFHEGNSLSGTGKNVTHAHSVFINCGQTVEAGYEGPTGTMIGCLATANLIGGRFGDNYNRTYTGFLRVTNSIVIHNYRDVWGMDWSSWSYNTARMDVRSNALTAPDAYWPANDVWNPATDAARLASYITGDASSPVGLGFALRTNWLTAAALTNGIPVRLSRFSTNVVSVNYAAESPSGVLASGTLDFQPGETVKNVNLAIANPQGHEFIAVSLSDPTQAEVTGLAQVFSMRTNAAPAPTTLIPLGATWRFSGSGVDQGTAWIPTAFDDSGWSNGAARLGFNSSGNTNIATVLSYGADANNKYRTYYFRKGFDVASVAAFTSLSLGVYRDDGVVVYLNGAEIFRSNITNGVPLSYYSFATNATDNGNTMQSATIPLTQLQNGTNVLAAEVHQTSPTSTDLVFDLQLTGNPALAPAWLKHAELGGQMALYWDNSTYVLEEAPELTGPWTPVASGANPCFIEPNIGQKYFRLKR